MALYIIPRGRKVYKMIWDAAILRKSTATEIFLTLLFVVKSYCRQPTFVLTGRKKSIARNVQRDRGFCEAFQTRTLVISPPFH